MYHILEARLSEVAYDSKYAYKLLTFQCKRGQIKTKEHAMALKSVPQAPATYRFKTMPEKQEGQKKKKLKNHL